jgi:GNAT superfamily N-acetyltransferase
MATVAVVRTYLEMKSPRRGESRDALPAGFVVRQVADDPGLYRGLYQGVGATYHWRDRLSWTDAQLREHLASPSISVHVLCEGEYPRGFFELARHDDGSREIAYFGLMPAAIGRGLGRALLACAIAEAWSMNPEPSRVWLHTCTLDHPAALANYLARGFQVARTESYTVDLSDH